MSLIQPTDAELDVMIRARLASIGIDLDQLPAGSTPDPETGSPGRDSVAGRPPQLRPYDDRAAERLPIRGLRPNRRPAALAQQVAAPALFPSIDITRQAR